MGLLDSLRAAATQPGLVQQSIEKWRSQPIPLTAGDFWSDWFGASKTGHAVTINSALQLSVVWACVRLISSSIATLPLTLYRQDGRKPVPARDHPLYEVLKHSPNADMTGVQFWEAAVASLLLRGNAFIEKRYVGNRIVAMNVLAPDSVEWKWLPDGSREYRYTPSYGNRTPRTIIARRMMHIVGFSLDGVTGLSAIKYGANSIGTAMSADDISSQTFRNGLNKTVAFKVDRVLKPEQRDEFREYVAKLSGALNAGKSPVLEQGVSAETIGIDPVDAQLLESRSYSVEDICRWFGVPPILIGHGDKQSSWPTSTEAQKDLFLMLALRPIIKRIEEAIRKDLLQPAERRFFYARFNIEGMLRADSAGRANLYSTYAQNGIMTRNEIRAKEELEPLPGGDDLTVQVNLTKLQDLGNDNEPETTA